jgi:hypothetical protein
LVCGINYKKNLIFQQIYAKKRNLIVDSKLLRKTKHKIIKMHFNTVTVATLFAFLAIIAFANAQQRGKSIVI